MLFLNRFSQSLSFRLIFIAICLLLGISALGVIIIEQYAGITIFINDTEQDKSTLHATLGIFGILSITIAIILINLTFFVRSNISLLYFRLFFIASFMVLGIFSVGISLLEQYAGMNIIRAVSGIDKAALHSSLYLMGILGVTVGSVMIYIIREKRQPSTDRRQTSQAIDFCERRSAGDRRTKSS
ncbi:MAG: hypothetical protein DRQ47_03820 [Gammaproteobacteria bacterium]|nr:MAG: hypothetical protein DRQ47_03820 [Gammaproteobacteria bacterium]